MRTAKLIEYHLQASQVHTSLRYRDQPVNVIRGEKDCLLRKACGTYKYTLWENDVGFHLNDGVTYTYHYTLKC